MPTRPGSAGDWQPLDTVSSTGPCDVRAIMNERPQPLDEGRAQKNIAKMMGTELGIATAHPFQLGAVLALAYNTVATLIRAPGDGKSTVVHAAMRLLRGVVATSLIGANQASGRLVYRTSIAHTFPSCRGLEGSRV